MFADALNGDSARRPGERVIRGYPASRGSLAAAALDVGLSFGNSDDELGIFTGLGSTCIVPPWLELCRLTTKVLGPSRG